MLNLGCVLISGGGPAFSPYVTSLHPFVARTVSILATLSDACKSLALQGTQTRTRKADSHQDQNHHRRDRNAEPPKVRIAILQRGELFEVHAKVTCQEGHGQEEDRDKGQLLHALVLVCAHGVEDERDHAICGAAHPLQRLDHRDAVVFYVAEVSMR